MPARHAAPTPAARPERSRTDPVHAYAYHLVDGRPRVAADPVEELIVEKPFEIRSSSARVMR